MPKIEWNKKLLTGLDKLDAFNRKTFVLAETLRLLVEEERSTEKIIYALDQLVEFAQRQFEEEKKLFIRFRYPLVHQHLSEHERLVLELTVFQRRWKNGAKVHVGKFAEYYAERFRDHVGRADFRFISFLEQMHPQALW